MKTYINNGDINNHNINNKEMSLDNQQSKTQFVSKTSPSISHLFPPSLKQTSILVDCIKLPPQTPQTKPTVASPMNHNTKDNTPNGQILHQFSASIATEMNNFVNNLSNTMQFNNNNGPISAPPISHPQPRGHQTLTQAVPNNSLSTSFQPFVQSSQQEIFQLPPIPPSLPPIMPPSLSNIHSSSSTNVNTGNILQKDLFMAPLIGNDGGIGGHMHRLNGNNNNSYKNNSNNNNDGKNGFKQQNSAIPSTLASNPSSTLPITTTTTITTTTNVAEAISPQIDFDASSPFFNMDLFENGLDLMMNMNGIDSMGNIPSEEVIKMYKCKDCDRTFQHKSNLKIHSKIHSPSAFICNYCGKRFARHSNLKQHTRVHTNERPFKCKFCTKSFKQQHSLVDHTRTHTGEKPHKCSYCEKSFAARCNLIVHTRIHTGERPYKCDICHKSYASKSGYNSHRKKYHPDG